MVVVGYVEAFTAGDISFLLIEDCNPLTVVRDSVIDGLLGRDLANLSVYICSKYKNPHL